METVSTNNVNMKEAASDLIRQMPDTATWEDLMYHIYVRQAIEKGLADSAAGRKLDVGQVKKMLGIAS
jgi:hypothetical protein